MRKSINAAVIGASVSKEVLSTLSSNELENISWKKIWSSNSISNSVTERHPEAEIVTRIESIINDDNIDLVFVSSHHLQYVKPAIESGKSVRVI